MILVMKNGKIIGIEKTLLNYLNTDLYNLSDTVNKIELELAALEKKSLNINNKNIKVIKKELISLDDITTYEIIPQTEETTEPLLQNEPEIPIQTLDEIKPINEEKPEINIDDFELTPPEIHKEEIPIIEEPLHHQETTPKIDIEEELLNVKPEVEIPQPKIENDFNPLEEIVPKTEENIIPEEPVQSQTDKIQEPISISISFEDELSEVQEILNLPKDEAKQLIQEEVKQAAQELGIDENMTKELLVDLYKQIDDEKENFKTALDKTDYEQLHKIAHKLKGAALNLRLSKLAYILKVIDEKSKQKAAVSTLRDLINKFYEFFDKINDNPKSTISPEIREIIMKTVQEYLETQNEKKFKKDKKYIEKLLNKKIDTIDDLKNILKG